MFAPAVADRRFAGKRAVATAYNLPAPVNGLNARDGYSDMKPDDALALVNVFPEANYVAVRKGYTSWATGMTNPIRTLMTYYGLTGADKLFACESTKIWDATASGAATSVVTGLGSADWQWTNIKTPGGAYLICCNGTDSVRSFDGTTWATPAITVVTSSTLCNVFQFKQRLWFVQNNSLSLWYLGTQAIAGAASEFPLGSVFRKGGYIVAAGSFSRDSGDGADDYLAVITSNGEIAVYQGTDPTSANTFALSGIFNTAAPIGRRCMARLNGDLSIVTANGVMSMNALLEFGRESDQKAAITARIQTLFSQYASDYSALFGWQVMTYPKARYLIVNVPMIANTTAGQLVMNTITGAWCQFSNMNTNCWGAANGALYFAGNAGVVYTADVGYQDNGSQINWEVRTSWQQPGGARNKLFKMVRPVMLTGSGVAFGIEVNTDFDTTTVLTGSISATAVTGNAWPWTWPGTWGGTNVLDARWQSVGSIGTWAAVHMVGATRGGACQINSFDLLAERGGVL